MSLNPFKKKQVVLSPAEQEEQRMIQTYSLVKDDDVPNRYWVNNEFYIDFIPGMPASVKNAETAIQEYYLHPQLNEATMEQKRTKPTKQKKKKASGIGSFLENAGKGAEKMFGPVGDQFIKNAPNVTNELSNVGMGTMRDGTRNAQALGNSGSLGVRPISIDDGLAGVNPKMDMDTILGTSPKPKPAVKKNE